MASAVASTSTLASPRSLYRSLIRELRFKPGSSAATAATAASASAAKASSSSRSRSPTSIVSPAFRSRPIVALVRETFRKEHVSSGIDERATARAAGVLNEMRNLEVYLRSNRVHKELLVRYNPLHDQTEAERVKATARRVGLDVPKEYQGHKDESEKRVEAGLHKAQQYAARTGGPLPPPDLD